MTRTDILNAIAKTIGAKRYVEIGVRNPGDNYDRIEVEHKTGVDPVPARGDILRMTSDQYFAAKPEPADLYFIDGLHTAVQVDTDLRNALALSPRAVVVLHDCLPRSLEAMTPEKPANGRPWNGTVWRTWWYLGTVAPWTSYCVDADHGCGVIWAQPRDYGATLNGFVTDPKEHLIALNSPTMAVPLLRIRPLSFILAALEARP
jgi:hypothetical protein